MAFEIDDIVILAVDITFSGETFPTTGQSGTVLDRQKVSIDSEGNDLFNYYVDLFEDLVVGSGVDQQTQSNFWLTEADLGNSQQNLIVDLGQVSSNLANARASTAQSKTSIDQTLAQIPTLSPYNSIIQSFSDTVATNQTILNSSEVGQGNTEGEINTNARSLDNSAMNLGFDAQVFQELTDNVFAVYTIVDEINQEILTDTAQKELQTQLAFEDDTLTFQTFYNSVVTNEGSQDLLVPQDSPPDSNTTDDATESLEPIEDPDTLITEALELDQDTEKILYRD